MGLCPIVSDFVFACSRATHTKVSPGNLDGIHEEFTKQFRILFRTLELSFVMTV